MCYTSVLARIYYPSSARACVRVDFEGVACWSRSQNDNKSGNEIRQTHVLTSASRVCLLRKPRLFPDSECSPVRLHPSQAYFPQALMQYRPGVESLRNWREFAEFKRKERFSWIDVGADLFVLSGGNSTRSLQ